MDSWLYWELVLGRDKFPIELGICLGQVKDPERSEGDKFPIELGIVIIYICPIEALLTIKLDIVYGL
jgi:hypothetical protein